MTEVNLSNACKTLKLNNKQETDNHHNARVISIILTSEHRRRKSSSGISSSNTLHRNPPWDLPVTSDDYMDMELPWYAPHTTVV